MEIFLKHHVENYPFFNGRYRGVENFTNQFAKKFDTPIYRI